MQDPVLMLAVDQRLVDDSSAIETQFDSVKDWRPVATIMVRLREEAAVALVRLARADPEDAKLIRDLQNEVNLYAAFVRHVHSLYLEGINAGLRLDAKAVEEAREAAGIYRDPEDAPTRNQSY